MACAPKGESPLSEHEEERAHCSIKPPIVADKEVVPPLGNRRDRRLAWDGYYDNLQEKVIFTTDSNYKLGTKDFGDVEDILQLRGSLCDEFHFHDYCHTSRGDRKFFNKIAELNGTDCPNLMDPHWGILVPMTEGFLSFAKNHSMDYHPRSIVFVLNARVEAPRASEGRTSRVVDPWPLWNGKPGWNVVAPVLVGDSSCQGYERTFVNLMPDERKSDEVIVLMDETTDGYRSRRLVLDPELRDYGTFVKELTTVNWPRCISFIVEKYPIPRVYLCYGGYRFRIKTNREVSAVFQLFEDYRDDRVDQVDETGADWSSADTSEPIFDGIFEDYKQKLDNANWFSRS